MEKMRPASELSSTGPYMRDNEPQQQIWNRRTSVLHPQHSFSRLRFFSSVIGIVFVSDFKNLPHLLHRTIYSFPLIWTFFPTNSEYIFFKKKGRYVPTTILIICSGSRRFGEQSSGQNSEIGKIICLVRRILPFFYGVGMSTTCGFAIVCSGVLGFFLGRYFL